MELTHRALDNRFVRLEPLNESHKEALRDLARDPSLWVQTRLNASEDYEGWFNAMMAANLDARQMSYAVFDKWQNTYAGHTSFLSIAKDHGRVEIGWTWYGTPFHGGYVNPSCKRLLLAHAFACAAERVELKTGGQNLRSQRAMEKMGAIREGVLRAHSLAWTGQRRDSVFFSILKDEWPSIRDGLDQRLDHFCTFEIRKDDPTLSDVKAIIEHHKHFTHENSPPKGCYSLGVSELQDTQTSLWTAREDGKVLAMIALKPLSEGHGEIKSMHTLESTRGRGIARALVAHLIDEARLRGWTQLSLESGRNEAFAPSRQLYAAMGFEPCPAFGDYKDNTFSFCMTRAI